MVSCSWIVLAPPHPSPASVVMVAVVVACELLVSPWWPSCPRAACARRGACRGEGPRKSHMMAYQKNFDVARRPNVDRRSCYTAGAALHFSAARPYVGVSGRFRPWLGSMRRPSGGVSRSVTLAGTASAADRQLHTLCSGKAAHLGRRCGGLAAEQRGRGPPQPPVRCGEGSSTPMRHPCAIDWAERGLPAGSVPSTGTWAPSSSAAPRAARRRRR